MSSLRPIWATKQHRIPQRGVGHDTEGKREREEEKTEGGEEKGQEGRKGKGRRTDFNITETQACTE